MPTFIPIERDPNAEVKQAFVYNEDFNINTPEFDNLSAAQKQIIENFINENTTNGNFLAPGTIISFNFDAAEPVWDASNGLKLNEDGQIVRRPTNSEWFVSVDDDGSIRLVEKEENGNVQYNGENFGWTIGENDNSLDGYLIGGEKVSKLIKEAEDNDETLGDYLKKQTNLSEKELATKIEDLKSNMNLIKEDYEEKQAQRDIAKAAAERADEVSADEVSADEAPADEAPADKSEQKTEPEQPEEQPEEKTEEPTEDQPEEQAKKKLWYTLKEAFSKFTIRSKTEKDVEKDVKAEIVESQNQGLKPVSEEKQPEEKQLSPEEIMKIDACTAIMMAHLEKYNIPYDSQTVKGIVQTALTGYAVALGSDRPLGDLRDANTTKRLISDVMNGITNDIQNRFGDQPIKVTTTVSFGKDEVRTIAKQMSIVLKILNDDHLGNSIRTTLVENFKIAAPLTVLYKELLEEKKNHETIIENNKTNISDLKEKIEEQKKSLKDAKKKFKAETGLDYDEITASKAPNTPDTNDTPDYSKILKPEYSELFEQCAFLSSNLNGLNQSLADEKGLDLPDIKDDDKKIRDMEEQLQKLGVSGITEFINKLNPIAVSSEEIPAPENPHSPELEKVLVAVGEKEKVPDEQPTPDAEQPTSADAVTPDASADAPADAPVDVPVDASADVPADVPVDASVDAPVDVPVDVPADVPVDASADAPVDVPVDVPATTPDSTPESASDENRESKGIKTKRTETMAKNGRDLTVNNAGSKAAAEAEAEAARNAAIPGEGEKRDNGHRNKTIK